MNKVIADLINDVSGYREGYLKDGLEVPAHEIVMHPKRFVDLMDDPDAMTHVDMTMEEHNFHGIPIITDQTVAKTVVRDRTVEVD